MFDDQVMGSDRGAKGNVAVDGLEGGDMSAEEDPFLAQRPSQGAAVALAPPQMIDSDDSDPQVLNRPRHGRVNSMLRPDATSLAPMAFGRERAGTAVGALTAPWDPNIHRDQELEQAHDFAIDDALTQVSPKVAPKLFRGARAQALRGRMNGDSGVFDHGYDGVPAPERAPHTQGELTAMGASMDYQEDAGRPDQRRLDPKRHWKFWKQAHPKKPGAGAFMSEPDAGWDRVQSRGALGIPWLASMIGSKLFGSKGGRYDRRKADLARRDGHFDRAWETYGSTAKGRKGVMPDWVGQSTWARGKWDKKVSAVEPTDMERRIRMMV